jgi:acetyltransferase-like isoleucine patch superfamily enzyme
MPSLAIKRGLLRATGMEVEDDVAIGLGAQFDIFWPEFITLRRNCIIGYNSTILCHEFLINSLRLGRVEIGKDVLIGTNTTILPGVKVGEGAVVSACSLVNTDVPARAFVGGVPIRKLRK